MRLRLALAILVLSPVLFGFGFCRPGPPPGPPDRDRDGVPDASDRCPDEQGPAENEGCPIPPVPETPPTGTPVAPNKLLRVAPGGQGLTTNDGQPFEWVQYVLCCTGFEATSQMVRKPVPFKINGVEIPTFWPGVGERVGAILKKRGAATMLHRRFGPFHVSEEPEWAAFGGPNNDDGTENEKFWKEQERITAWGERNGLWFEDVPIDTWGCKYSQNTGKYLNWSPEAIKACGHTWHPEHEQHLRNYVKHIGCYGNVVVAMDNEGEGIRNYDPAWFRTLHTRYRALEQELGCGFIKMTGSSVPGIFNVVDYTITHNRSPLTTPIGGKFTVNNEHNPEFPSAQEAGYFDEARKKKILAWGLWRAGASQPAYEDTMRRVKEIVTGSGTAECFAPLPEDPLWEFIGPSGTPTRRQAVKDAQAVVGNQCREPRAHQHCIDALDKLAAELRRKGYCASRNVDSITILGGPTTNSLLHRILSLFRRPKVEYLWEEHHACSPFDTGCWSNNPDHYPKNFWRYRGTNPTPPVACGPPTPPPLSQFKAKVHTVGDNWTTLDSTPLVQGADYCAAIGFTDGRSECPLRQEGAEDRSACEALRVGTPQWSGVQGEVLPDNPYLYRVRRGTSGTARVCTSVSPAVCGSVNVAP